MTDEGEYSPVTHADVVRNLVTFGLTPLVEAISRNQAAPVLERGAIGRFLGHGLDRGIDG